MDYIIYNLFLAQNAILHFLKHYNVYDFKTTWYWNDSIQNNIDTIQSKIIVIRLKTKLSLEINYKRKTGLNCGSEDSKTGFSEI